MSRRLLDGVRMLLIFQAKGDSKMYEEMGRMHWVA
jgi:hypothetical protein